jgi:hypothetical protein
VVDVVLPARKNEKNEDGVPRPLMDLFNKVLFVSDGKSSAELSSIVCAGQVHTYN